MINVKTNFTPMSYLHISNTSNNTIVSCAKCYSITNLPGKVKVDCCPSCGSTNKDLTRARYWFNGQPDFSVNLMR